MLPDRVSNPGPLTYESAALLIALRGPACDFGGRDMNTRAALFISTRNIVTTSSTEPYSLMKISLLVFKTEGIVALTIKGR